MSDSEIPSFEPPEIKAVPRGKRTKKRTPQQGDFASLALQLKAFGALVLLVGLTFLLAFSGLGSAVAVCLGWLVFLTGIGMIVVGFGMNSYKKWAWFGAVASLIPVGVLIIALMLSLAIRMLGNDASVENFETSISILGMSLAYLLFLLKTLIFKSGRERYHETRLAIERAKANPDSTTGRLYKKGR